MTWVIKGSLSLTEAEKLSDSVEQWAETSGALLEPVASFFENEDLSFQMEIFMDGKPTPDQVSNLLSIAKLDDWAYTLDEIEEKDWVSETQKMLHPIKAGRFYIHGSHDRGTNPEGATALEIEAGQAFGTGRHETTYLCLERIETLATEIKPKNVLDLGTGSGVLAMAAQTIWPDTNTLATDIDPIAIDVTRDNLGVNGFQERGVGTLSSGISLAVLDGAKGPATDQEGPFDLLIANILAGPLMLMADDICTAAAKDGVILLSGILEEQAADVLTCYAEQGWHCHTHYVAGDWCALTFKRTKPETEVLVTEYAPAV